MNIVKVSLASNILYDNKSFLLLANHNPLTICMTLTGQNLNFPRDSVIKIESSKIVKRIDLVLNQK